MPSLDLQGTRRSLYGIGFYPTPLGEKAASTADGVACSREMLAKALDHLHPADLFAVAALADSLARTPRAVTQ